MPIVDTHCHATPYWFEPVEILLDQMTRNDVDHAVLIQINGVFDNSYLVECLRRFPGRFSGVGMVDVGSTDAPEHLAEFLPWDWRVCASTPPTGRLETTRWLFGVRQRSWA